MELLIVNFHYYGEAVYKSGIYPISHANFVSQLNELSKTYQFISQHDLLDFLEEKPEKSGKYCLLTFDDGLKEQMVAFDTLNKMGIPAMFYVPTDPIAQKKVLDVHRLHYIRANSDDQFLFELLDERYNIASYTFDDTALAIQYRYDDELARKVKYFLNFELDDLQRQDFLRLAFSEVVPDEASFAAGFYMDLFDLNKLAQAGALGSHSASHRPLAKMPFAEAKEDILTSIALLETWTGQPIRSFSYPYGGSTAVSQDLAAAFPNTNVCFALTMTRGINCKADFQQPFFLRRVDTKDLQKGNYSK